MPVEHTISVTLEGSSECRRYFGRQPHCLAKANTQTPRAESDFSYGLRAKQRVEKPGHHLRGLYGALHLLMAPGSLPLFTARPVKQTPSPKREPHPNAKNLSSKGCLAIEI